MLARNPGGIVGSQKNGRFSNICGLAPATQRGIGHKHFLIVTARRDTRTTGPFRVRCARQNRIDPDVSGPQFFRQRNRKGIYGRFRGRIQRNARHRRFASPRTNVDDVAPFVAKQVQRGLTSQNRPQYIDVEMLVKRFDRGLFNREELLKDCVVDQNIQRAERLLGFGKQPADIGFV